MHNSTPTPETETGSQTAAATAAVTTINSQLKLSKIQKRFCHEYIRDFKPHRAAERAGYSPSYARTGIYTLLKQTNIALYINTLIYKMREELNVKPSQLIMQLKAIAFSQPTDFIEIVEETQKLMGKTTTVQTLKIKSLENIPLHAKNALSEIRQTKNGLVIKTHNKLSAINTLGLRLGLFKKYSEQTERLDEQILYVYDENYNEINLPDPDPDFNSPFTDFAHTQGLLKNDFSEEDCKNLVSENLEKIEPGKTGKSEGPKDLLHLKPPNKDSFPSLLPSAEGARRAAQVGGLGAQNGKNHISAFEENTEPAPTTNPKQVQQTDSTNHQTPLSFSEENGKSHVSNFEENML